MGVWRYHNLLLFDGINFDFANVCQSIIKQSTRSYQKHVPERSILKNPPLLSDQSTVGYFDGVE